MQSADLYTGDLTSSNSGAISSVTPPSPAPTSSSLPILSNSSLPMSVSDADPAPARAVRPKTLAADCRSSTCGGLREIWSFVRKDLHWHGQKSGSHHFFTSLFEKLNANVLSEVTYMHSVPAKDSRHEKVTARVWWKQLRTKDSGGLHSEERVGVRI
eukprot:622583-Rhodomonas_salina.1